MCLEDELRLITTLHVLMSLKKDIVYQRGKSKSAAPFHRLIVDSDIEQDPTYVLLDTKTQTPFARVTQGTPRKVVPSAVTASQCDEECTLTDSLS